MLSTQNIESELSYAYLHAVACRAGFSCEWSNRHLDDAGVDAVIREDGRRLANDSLLTSFEVHIQLKATIVVPSEQGGCFSYSLKVPQYDKLRSDKVNSARFLVVFYLPEADHEWLNHSEDCLVAKRCAYWVSLRNAPPSANPKHQTVYIPKHQILSVEGLHRLMTRCSRREVIQYEGHDASAESDEPRNAPGA